MEGLGLVATLQGVYISGLWGSSHVLPWSPSIAPSPSKLLFQSQTLLKAGQRLPWTLVPQGGDSTCLQLVCAAGQESLTLTPAWIRLDTGFWGRLRVLRPTVVHLPWC